MMRAAYSMALTPWGVSAECALAAYAALVGALALVRDHRLHAGGLADDGAGGADAVARQVFEQAARADAAHFLVIGECKINRRLEIGRGKARRHRQDDGEVAFHVAGAAAVELVASHRRLERIARPVLAVHRHHVGVPREHNAGFVSFLHGGEQIRLVAAGIIGEARLDAVGLEVIAHPLDQAEVGTAAGGIEAD